MNDAIRSLADKITWASKSEAAPAGNHRPPALRSRPRRWPAPVSSVACLVTVVLPSAWQSEILGPVA
jgi:hypothetical protein